MASCIENYISKLLNLCFPLVIFLNIRWDNKVKLLQNRFYNSFYLKIVSSKISLVAQISLVIRHRIKWWM